MKKYQKIKDYHDQPTMKKLFIKTKRVEQGYLNELIRHKDTNIRQTGSTLTVTTDRIKMIVADSSLSPAELNIIKKVKKDATDFMKVNHVQPVPYFQIPFKRMNPAYFNSMNNEVIAVDIKSAYPTTLKNLGVISPETYSKVMAIDKGKRMWVIGTLASSPSIREYRNGKLDREYIKCAETLPIWQNVVKKVDDLMKGMMKEFTTYPNNELFCFAYYVDCLFFIAPKNSGLFNELFLPELSERLTGYEFSCTYGTRQKQNGAGKMVQFLFKEDIKTYFYSDNRKVNFSKSVFN